MKILLDTCTFLWIALDSDELSETARHLFLTAETVYLSAASAWEIAVKSGLNRLPLPESPHRWVPRVRTDHGIEQLPINEESALHLLSLPDIHKDPFDRMLVSQAIIGGLTLLTPDPQIQRYPARVMW